MPTKKKAPEPDEPSVKWKRIEAKKLLFQDLINGEVPLDAKNEQGKITMRLKDIWLKRDEYQLYKYSKFSSRLSSLRVTAKETLSPKELDQEAFDNYLENHEVSHTTGKGFIQWQGSGAQRLLRADLESNENEALEWEVWFNSNEEFYDNFTLDLFRDKVNQEIRTVKYLHTLKVRGKDTRKTKRRMKPEDHRPPME